METQKEQKKMVALEMPESTYKELKALEAEYGGIGISGIIRMIIVDYLKRYTKKGNKK